MSKLSRLIGAFQEKPLDVILFKVRQSISLSLMSIFGRWQASVSEIGKKITDPSVRKHMENFIPFLVTEENVKSVLKDLEGNQYLSGVVEKFSHKINSSEFRIFGSKIPNFDEVCWHTDWLCDYSWKPQYFKRYSFYELRKPRPYDVKRPWELSRFSYFMPLLQNAIVNNCESDYRLVERVFIDWYKKNPLAHSVNWYPMEASMRAINLVIILQLVFHFQKNKKLKEALFPRYLLRSLAEHGKFIKKTLEYTDVRGNHYAANIVALYLIGLTLEGVYKRASRWQKFARDEIDKEVCLQFLTDGVNFERSIPYHRLVLEVFLTAAIAARNTHNKFNKKLLQRLHAASKYLVSTRAPNGLSPNLGDNDSAYVFCFDDIPNRDYAALFSIAAEFFSDNSLRPLGHKHLMTCSWLTGAVFDEGKDECGVFNYPSGGVVIVKTPTIHFLADVGDIGMKGRGGHGHNDLLSYTLSMNNSSLIVDPGSPTYTGDLALKNAYRVTSKHNVLQVADEEMAPLLGHWRIANVAQPANFFMLDKINSCFFSCENTGYLQRENPVKLKRSWTIDKETALFECHDLVDCKNNENIKRYIHFHNEIVINQVESFKFELSKSDQKWFLEVDNNSTMQILPDTISPGYGEEVESNTIVLSSMAKRGSNTFYYKLYEA